MLKIILGIINGNINIIRIPGSSKQPAHLFQHTCRKECNDRENGDDTHITNDLMDRVFDTPQANGEQTDKCHPILLESKRFLGRTYSLDFDISLTVRRAGRTVRREEKQPNEDNRNSRNREGDSKPLRPTQRVVHGFNRNQVLWWRNRGTLSSNIGR